MSYIYKLTKVFPSIQGEGARTGLPSVFVRFAGCNRKCEWCDTNYYDFLEIELLQLVQDIGDFHIKNVILTGGEPTMQKIVPLVCALKSRGMNIGIETNGHDLYQFPHEIVDDFAYFTDMIKRPDWIAYSPKVTPTEFQFLVDEVKVIWGSGVDLDIVKMCVKARNYFVQPMWKDGKMINLRECINFVMAHPTWRLSIQTHKLIGVE